MRAFLFISFLLSLTLAASESLGQQPMKVAVDLVNVGFSMRDAHGGLVDHLRQDDVRYEKTGYPRKSLSLPAAWTFP